MKQRILALLSAILFLLSGGQAALAQSINNSTNGSTQSFVAGKFIANNYNYTNALVAIGNASTGSSTITLRSGAIQLPDSRTIVPFAVGVPIVISDANPELVVPTTVSGCTKLGGNGSNQDLPFVTCVITASFSFTHGAYAQVLSGTNGIAEAVNDAFNWGGGTVVIAPGWSLGLNSACTSCYASKATALAAITPYPNIVLEDDTLGTVQPYAVRPTGTTAVSAASAPTVTFASGANSYYCGVAYVDVYGQISQFTEEASQSTSAAFPATVTAPAAATGVVGYIPYCTAASGSTKTETMYAVTSSMCSVTKIETIIPACTVTNTTYNQTGSNAVLTAAPATTTAKIIGAAATDTSNNTRTTAQYQPVASESAVFNFNNVWASLPASSSGNAATYEIGSINLPSGFFNIVGKKYNVCIDWEATAASTAVVTWNLYYGPYNNSDTKIVAVPSGSFSGSGAHTQNQACFNLTTVTTGATGSILTSGYEMSALASTNVGTLELVDNSTSSPIIGSLPLSTQQQLRLEAVVATANLGSAITVDGLSIFPLN